MLTDEELPPLPTESYVNEDGLWEQRIVLTEESVREYARAVEQAAYAAAIKACEAVKCDGATKAAQAYNEAIFNCQCAIEELMTQEQPK